MICGPFKSRGYDVTIWPEAKIVQTESISVGNHVIVDDFCFIVGGKSTWIGNHVHIASFVSITGGGDLVIEDFCGVSSGTRIFTGDDDYKGGCLTNPTVPAPFRVANRSFVHIKKHALIGANCVVLAGVTVGEGCAIGAGSIVLKDTEPWSIYVGNPARKIGERPKENIQRLERELLSKKSQDPLVSVCCCTYNQAHLIRSALDGFLMQKCKFPFEILVHDDASRDGTQSVLTEYQRKNPDLIKIIFQKENLFSKTGKYPVVNLYKEARGKYIAECDGDDYWTDPYKLQRQVDFLESNPGYVMCHHDYIIEQDGMRRRPDPAPPKDYSASELLGYNSEGYGIGLCTRMFRNLYNAATAKDIEQMVGDYPMVVYLGTIGKCKYLPGIKPSVYRRMNGTNSWCSLPPVEMAKRTAAMQKNIYDFFRRKNDPTGMEIRRKFVERRLWQ